MLLFFYFYRQCIHDGPTPAALLPPLCVRGAAALGAHRCQGHTWSGQLSGQVGRHCIWVSSHNDVILSHKSEYRNQVQTETRPEEGAPGASHIWDLTKLGGIAERTEKEPIKREKKAREV